MSHTVKFSAKSKGGLVDVNTFYPADLELLATAIKPYVKKLPYSGIRRKLEAVCRINEYTGRPVECVQLGRRGVLSLFYAVQMALHDLCDTLAYDASQLLKTKAIDKSCVVDFVESAEYEELLVLSMMLRSLHHFLEGGKSLVIREYRTPDLRMVV